MRLRLMISPRRRNLRCAISRIGFCFSFKFVEAEDLAVMSLRIYDFNFGHLNKAVDAKMSTREVQQWRA